MGGGDSEFDQKMDVNDAERLKYLGFVQAAALHTILCFASLYAYAKDKSGPLKPGVESVEGAVKTVVAPVYLKFHDIPIELLKFVDRKMNESVTKLDNRIPPMVKRVSTQALCAAQKAPEVARCLVSEVQREGVMGTAKNTADGVMGVAKNTALNTADGVMGVAKNTALNTALSAYVKYEPVAKELYSKYEPAAKELYAKYEPAAKELYSKYEPAAKEIYTKYEPTAKELYSKYEPVAERYAVSAWQKLNQLPLFPMVADVVVPTAAYCSEKYNQTVRSKAEDGYTVASYLPLVPTDKIAKVFSAQNHEVETEMPVS